MPVDRPVYDGDIATYWFDDGILVSRSKPVRRTVANIAANVVLVQRITGGTPAPLLIHLARSPMPDRATRRFSKLQLPRIYTAMAMVAEPGLASLIMKVLFGLQSPPIPMKQFTDERAARAWLAAQLRTTR
ncbi:MAG: STAS/SEC14 domain-containing protein [Myxococcales bacterium]|nr:STAS/SEC14 domain-containing protein [Myxococcales bacterium]